MCGGAYLGLLLTECLTNKFLSSKLMKEWYKTIRFLTVSWTH